jgi:mycothiol maleylpyruvate isomerase-like protein
LRGDPAEELDAYQASLPTDRPFTVDGLNAFLVNNRAGLPHREVIATWGQAAQAALDFAAALSDDAWRDERFAWLLGSIAARYLVQSRVVEWWVHGEDIRATTGLGPQIQHWPIFLTVDMGVRMLPWTLGEAGIDLQGASVQIDLEGAGEGSWHWGLGAGEAPPSDKKPDAFIQGRGAQFALVAAHRLPVDDVLDSGNVVLGGEAGIAETVVRHIRAYA